MNFIDIKGSLHNRCILDIIFLSQYLPTEEKLNHLAEMYESDANVFSFACNVNGITCGVIILKRLIKDEFEILSIATSPTVRNKGIASKLISFSIKALKCSILKAETDDDAIGFYRKYGFQLVSSEEKYPGTIRYLCTLKLS
ncbi:GNAT family N-acetyltransferase [Lacrimispora xylanisolvens]|uniref:GNAT family N-acetyltransferase n=1 Tax=Lacrimispora xylanisolvens TaxID=384636 RepID=UPI0024028543|nr:GNAT family N-acetyltransferase [Paenibacillaceae bacterium]